MGAYCAHQRAIGLGDAPGAFAEYVAVAPHEVVRLPDGVDDDHGAMVEPLAVGLHAVNVSRIRRGERCLVIGGGPIGLAILLWARHFGAEEVIVSDPLAARRAMAERLGATRVVDPSREDLGAILGANAPATVVFDCAGAPGLLATAVEHVQFRGRVVVVGICMEPDAFPPLPAILKEATLHFVLAYEKDDFQFTVDLLDQGRIVPGPMVTDCIGLDAVPAMFDTLAAPQGQCKVLVFPRS
jgi:(R,R)-butanediol dehydrogenase/meso-butanediol dehydrogenase/diacetyl reductase